LYESRDTVGYPPPTVRWLQKLHRQQEKELLHDGQHIQVREYTDMGDRGRSRENREGWPLPTVEIEANGD
jgi:hypothetical protein